MQGFFRKLVHFFLLTQLLISSTVENMKQIQVSRSELEELYKSSSIRDICEHLGLRSPAVLYRLLDEAGIPRKRTVREYVKTILID